MKPDPLFHCDCDICKAFRATQIERGANGYIAGTLKDWPGLRAALEAQGIKDLPPETRARELRALCRTMLAESTGTTASAQQERQEAGPRFAEAVFVVFLAIGAATSLAGAWVLARFLLGGLKLL